MGDNYISCKAENGSINISEDVISTMVRTAITEIDGVAGISNTAGAELAELIGIKTVSKGIKVPTDNSAGNFVKIQQRVPVRIDFTNLSKEIVALWSTSTLTRWQASKRWLMTICVCKSSFIAS